jgi:hypothetical protein
VVDLRASISPSANTSQARGEQGQKSRAGQTLAEESRSRW